MKLFSHLPRTFWVLLVVGALLRVAAIELRPAGALPEAPDESDYLEIAGNIAAGNGFVFQDRPTAYRDMLFPVWAAAKGSVLGEVRGVFYAQLIVDLMTALFLFLLVRRRLSERAALLAGGAWLLYPAAILFTALFLTETLFLFFWVLALWLFDGTTERTALRHYVLGVVLGLLMLTRSTGVILVAAILFVLLYRRAWKPSAVILATLFLTVLPWMLRNRAAVDSFTLNTNSGVNLWIGNNPHATGAYRFDAPVMAPLEYGRIGEVARNRRATELALAYMRDNPVRTLALWPKKFAYFWSTDMALWVHYAPWPRNAHRPDPPLAAQLRAAPAPVLIVTGLFYVLLAAAGIAGLLLVKNVPLRAVLLAQVALATLSAFATYGLARYHFPLMPALIIGAVSLGEPGAWRDASRRQRFAATGLILLLLAVWAAETATILSAGSPYG